MNTIYFPSLVILSFSLLTGCGFLQDYFPDKEKDYQLDAEIPALNVPATVAKSGLEKPAPRPQLADDTEKVAVIPEIIKTYSSKPNTPATAVVEETLPNEEPTQVELIKFNNGAIRLRFNKPLATSVRMVSKALTRNGLEITRRDQANGEFTVQYDPNATPFQDDDFLDDLNFLFAPDHSQEKPYHLKLVEAQRVTEMAVLDSQNQPLTDGGGLSLLKRILTTLKADLATESSQK